MLPSYLDKKDGYAQNQADATAHSRGNGKNDLQESEMTQSSSQVSDEETANGGWFGSMSNDFRNIATCFKDTTLPVIGGVANFVHKTAMTVAAEIAELERDGELEQGESWQQDESESLCLPWEIEKRSKDDIPVYFTDGELMDLILALSREECTFTEPYSATGETSGTDRPFVLDEPRITLIRRLLDADENLSMVHARLSGKGGVHENLFWRNYFHHCEETRKDYLDQLSRQNKASASAVSLTNVPSSAKISSSGALSTLSELDASLPDDDESLVPASDTDESSYVIYRPAPTSDQTFATTRSLEDDLVLVGGLSPSRGGPK